MSCKKVIITYKDIKSTIAYDKHNGEYIGHHPNRNMSIKVYFINDKENGEYNWYNENGNTVNKCYFINRKKMENVSIIKMDL